MVKQVFMTAKTVNKTTVGKLDWKTKTSRKTYDGTPVQLELDLYQKTPGGLTAEESAAYCKMKKNGKGK